MNIIGTFLISMLLINVLGVAFAVRSNSTLTGGDEAHAKGLDTAMTLQSNTAVRNVPSIDNNFFFKGFARENVISWEEYTNYWVENGSVQLVVGVRSQDFQSYMSLENLVVKGGGKVVDTVSSKNRIIAFVVDLPAENAASFADKARSVGSVRYVESSVRFEAQLVPNDPFWSLQWGPRKIEADWAWNTTVGTHNILVAVIDTGVDWNHPDLAANYVPLGYDWVNGDFDPVDDNGHGTHCAGIIAAVINNGVGIAGLAQVQIMAEKGLDQYGDGNDYQLANAIMHAADQGADIISMSWGSGESSQVLYDAIRYAYDAGVLLVAAAGNQATSMKMYPAAYDEVVAIGATDQSDIPAYFSNFGDWIELAAPGVNIYSTMPTYWVTLNGFGYAMNYDYLSGTSMACPHVAGVAALVLSQFSNVERDWVRLWLRYTVDDLGQTGFDERYGYGRINARKAITTVPPIHELMFAGVDIPSYVEPGGVALVNGTVSNFGSSNETDVEVQLFVNGTMVDFAITGFIQGHTKTTVCLEWNPVIEGRYNVTFYIVPVPEETTGNNKVTIFTLVSRPLINPLEGQYANYTVYVRLSDPPTYVYGGLFYVSYLEYLAPYLMNVTMTSMSDGYSYSSWLVVSTIDRKVVAPSSPSETYYPYWIETNITIGSAVKLLDTIATVVDSEPVQVSHRLVDCWKLSMTYYGYGYSLWFDKISGVMILLESLVNGTVSGSILTDTNIPIGGGEHDLAVSVKAPDYLAPGTSVSLEATVYNTGLNNMSDVELYLLIDGSIVASTIIPELVVGSSYSISYLWSPSSRATFNITAYAPPKPEESILANNAVSKFTEVRRPLINPVEGQWANYTLRLLNSSSNQTALEQEWRFAYGPYLTPTLINTTIAIRTSGANDSQPIETTSYDLTINIMDRLINAGSMSWWVGTWYIGWIETNIDLGSSLNWWTDRGTVVGNRAIRVGDMMIDCWEVYADFTYLNATAWYDRESGLLIGWEERSQDFRDNITLTATNIPIGSAAFVHRCYGDLLFRDPEPEGLAFWVGELESGRLTRAGFVEALLNSEEYQNNWRNRLFVALMYDGVLERVPDQGGYDFHVAALNAAAMTWEQMLDGWFNSVEWNTRFGELDNAEFVTKLYRGMLHREPDAEGLSFWADKLEIGEFTRPELIRAFYECLEYQIVNPEERFVYQLYLGLLRRTPETEGYECWLEALHSGVARHDMINGFLTCSEYNMIHRTP